MLELERILDGLPKDLTILFFAAFSRFEYSLMRRGLLVSSRARAEADWHTLSENLGEGFFSEVVIAGRAQTLINDPPKKLVVREGRAVFASRPPPAKNTKQLLQSAKGVRNNLFHGSKMFAANRRRDEQLMREVLWLLEFIMEKQPHLRDAFDEPQANL